MEVIRSRFAGDEAKASSLFMYERISVNSDTATCDAENRIATITELPALDGGTATPPRCDF
jgi:hypothetical protein